MSNFSDNVGHTVFQHTLNCLCQNFMTQTSMCDVAEDYTNDQTWKISLLELPTEGKKGS